MKGFVSHPVLPAAMVHQMGNLNGLDQVEFDNLIHQHSEKPSLVFSVNNQISSLEAQHLKNNGHSSRTDFADQWFD